MDGAIKLETLNPAEFKAIDLYLILSSKVIPIFLGNINFARFLNE